MAGIDGHVRTYRLNASVRVAKFTALIVDAADTTTVSGALFAKVPTASNQGPVQGVTIEHWLEPNAFYQEDTDPSTITGTVPAPPYASMLGGTGLQIGPSLQISGQARCYAGAAAVITAGQVVVVADAFGRIDSAVHLAIAGGTKVYPVGIARSNSAGANSVVLVELMFLPMSYVVGA